MVFSHSADKPIKAGNYRLELSAFSMKRQISPIKTIDNQMNAPPRRLWLIFFSDGGETTFWSRMLRPGFRHVCAASYDSAQERWIYVNPTRCGLVVTVAGPDEFGPRFQQLMVDSTAILRIASQDCRRRMPAWFCCVGAIKSLVGINSRALSVFGLFRDLLRHGAEKVEQPDVRCIRERAGTAEGRPLDCGRAPAAAASG